MTKFTVVHPSGEVVASGLSVNDALNEILYYDGCDYRITSDTDDVGTFYALEICGSRNRYGGPGPFKQAWANHTPIGCYADNEDGARTEFLDAIRFNWVGIGCPECMTDDEYRADAECDA